MRLAQIVEMVEQRKSLQITPLRIDNINSISVNDGIFVKKGTSVKDFDIFDDIDIVYENNINYNMNESSLSQLMGRLGIRYAYNSLVSNFENCEGINEFLQELIKYAIKAYGNKKIQLITDEERERIVGVVGERYRMTRHVDILEPAIEKFGTEINERTSYINEKVMHVAFKPSITRTAKSIGEIVGFGPSIYNSDNGWSSVGVGLFALILRCTNGQTLPREFFSNKIIHTAKNPQERFMELLTATFTDDMGDGFIKYVDKVAQRPAILIDATEIPNITRKYEIPEKYEEGIIDYAVNENHDLPLNGYGIFNAINGYVSHHIESETVAEELLLSGFKILQIGADIKYAQRLIKTKQ